MIGAWKDHYNRVRPHSALRYRPPAPVTHTFATHRPTSPTMQSSHKTRSKIPVRSVSVRL